METLMTHKFQLFERCATIGRVEYNGYNEANRRALIRGRTPSVEPRSHNRVTAPRYVTGT